MLVIVVGFYSWFFVIGCWFLVVGVIVGCWFVIVVVVAVAAEALNGLL